MVGFSAADYLTASRVVAESNPLDPLVAELRKQADHAELRERYAARMGLVGLDHENAYERGAELITFLLHEGWTPPDKDRDRIPNAY